MTIFELLLLAIGLSMDAFAVSICKGLAIKKITLKECCIVGLWFGGFQALMPTVGYFLGSQFASLIESFDHWVAFILLGLIGGNMIREALTEPGCEDGACDINAVSLAFKPMLAMAVATSIDALAVGVSFAFLKVDIFKAAAFIGITTFTLSAAGTKIGNVFGAKYERKAEFAGGVILVVLGTKILLEHLGIL
jgi:putative Mn2+ efflux pump MntP